MQQPASRASTERPPRLSIGVPVYNEQRYLDGCLRSIVAQTFTDFEIIICDNASTDRTREIALEWAARDPRISVHTAEKNVGAAGNFNRAFALAGGELFKWCAADDLLLPDYFERCVKALDATPDAVLAWSGAIDIDADGEVIGEIHDNRWPLRFESRSVQERFLDLVTQNHSCITVFGVMRTADLRKTHLIGHYAASDHVLLAEMALRGRFVRVGDDLLRHREHENRFTRRLKTQQDRGAWFDTRLRGPGFPSWRLLKEYTRAALASPLGLKDKLGCLLQIARWLKWGQSRMLIADIRYHLNRSAGTSG